MADISVTLVYSNRARQTTEIALTLAQGCTVSHALADYPELVLSSKEIGIFGRKVDVNTPLNNLDRIELYRPLRVDPKTARRERFAKQGARSAGLFAQRRPGAKPGY